MSKVHRASGLDLILCGVWCAGQVHGILKQLKQDTYCDSAFYMFLRAQDDSGQVVIDGLEVCSTLQLHADSMITWGTGWVHDAIAGGGRHGQGGGLKISP